MLATDLKSSTVLKIGKMHSAGCGGHHPLKSHVHVQFCMLQGCMATSPPLHDSNTTSAAVPTGCHNMHFPQCNCVAKASKQHFHMAKALAKLTSRYEPEESPLSRSPTSALLALAPFTHPCITKVFNNAGMASSLRGLELLCTLRSTQRLKMWHVLVLWGPPGFVFRPLHPRCSRAPQWETLHQSSRNFGTYLSHR